jgi:diguanylate cyclase (GGDEF)-like protein/PAS domain S-box-containing protein
MSATGEPLIDFFTGGGAYMPRTHCIIDQTGNTDWAWVATLLVLTLGVVISYLRIFAFWMRCYFGEQKRDRNGKLFDLAMVFLLCAICGYALSILMFFWPGYRLLAGFLVVLNFFAWKFCLSLQPFAMAFKGGRLERELREEIQSRATLLESLLASKTTELSESERRFRTVVQNIPGVAFRVAIDEKWTNLFVSDGIALITGYPASDFINNAERDCASITHPDDIERVEAAVAAAVEQRGSYCVEYRVRHKDGSVKWVQEQAQVVCEERTDQPLYLDGVQIDITDLKLTEEALKRSSLHDKLTGLPNRSLLMDRLRMCVARKTRNRDEHFAVLFIDFDRFKVVNDCLGHEAGDELLRQIAARLTGLLRQTDTVARPIGLREHGEQLVGRLGGDEFIIILEDLTAPEDAMVVAERIVQASRAPYDVNGHEIISTASVGVVTSRDGLQSSEDMLRDADTAMYEAKFAGKDRVMRFDARMHDRIQERLMLEKELRGAIAANQMSVVYQPIVCLESGAWLGAEALVRWNNPRRGNVPPTEFIAIAEEAGIIDEVGEWVLRNACKQLMEWQRMLGESCPNYMSVNLSRSQLALANLPDRIRAVLRETGVEPQRILLEVTENQAAVGQKEMIATLQRLRAIGVRLAMDDFGTGLSSLSGLHQLPINVLKIDRSFVNNLSNGRQFMALARSIIDLASNLGLTTVAEGIETTEHLISLQALGCTHGQGYHFAKPMSPIDFENRIRNSLPRADAA